MPKTRIQQAWDDYHFETWGDSPDAMSETEARTHGQDKTTDTPAFQAHRDAQAGNLNAVEDGIGDL